jgi:hypothetical protein
MDNDEENKKIEDAEEKKQILKYKLKQFTKKFSFTFPLFPFSVDVVDLFEDLSKSQTSIDIKIKNAYGSLQNTTDLLDEIEVLLTEKNKKLITLREDYERLSALAQVEEDKAKAVIKQVESALNKERNREHWISFFLEIFAGLIVFFMGVLLSPIIKAWFGINV